MLLVRLITMATGTRVAALGRALPIRLSTRFVPTRKPSADTEDGLASLQLLVRGGYIRASSSGIYTLLPNGLRILDKVVRIIDEEMGQIGASRVAMPTVLPSRLWTQTGRYEIMGSELYKLQDRKGAQYVLAPTHEEEITQLVSSDVESQRQLPLRLYQVTSKFRDEPRPRMGLLRTKEFLMKDLYTFDADVGAASATYDQVRGAYTRIFDRIFAAPERRWRAAEADAGAIGGNKSHEYHIVDPAGEDTLLSCSTCEYVANTEKAVSLPSETHTPISADDVRIVLYGSNDVQLGDQVLHALVLPATRTLSATKAEKVIAAHHKGGGKLQRLYDSAQPAATAWDWRDRPEGPMVRFSSVNLLADFECAPLDPAELNDALVATLNAFASPHASASAHLSLVDLFPTQFLAGEDAPPPSPVMVMVDIRDAQPGDTCPHCRTAAAKLHESKAIEIGHTFYLGDKYSRALNTGFAPTAGSAPTDTLSNGRVPFQMGCYGIGVSRILGALAQLAVTQFDASPQRSKAKSGFVWPASVAPFTAVVLVSDPRDAAKMTAAEQVYAALIARAKRDDTTIRAALLRLCQQPAQPEHSGGFDRDEEQEIVLDDRIGPSLGAKLADSDLAGYTFRIILGSRFHADDPDRAVEVQYLTPTGWLTTHIPYTLFARQ